MIRIAQIINTHALKGEVKLYLYTDSPKERFVPGTVFETESGKELKLVSFRLQKGFGYAKFAAIDTIEQAEALKGTILELEEKDLPDPEEGEYYYHQLLGCTVENEAGETLGEVTDILETGANLVLRVKDQEGQFLLPFVDAHVKSVDVDGKKITIVEMEGLR